MWGRAEGGVARGADSRAATSPAVGAALLQAPHPIRVRACALHALPPHDAGEASNPDAGVGQQLPHHCVVSAVGKVRDCRRSALGTRSTPPSPLYNHPQMKLQHQISWRSTTVAAAGCHPIRLLHSFSLAHVPRWPKAVCCVHSAPDAQRSSPNPPVLQQRKQLHSYF